MKNLKVAAVFLAGCFLASCAAEPKASVTHSANHRLSKVRTTAYSRNEKGGRHNAVGMSLSGKRVMSAACDWSRYPLGTRFRIVDTKEEYIIDDYGTALIGTNTIDLYKPSRLDMKRWGVRHVDIDILEWGSNERSLKVLAPRSRHGHVRQMIAGLQKKTSGSSTTRTID
jgi:3D (Asp-Asp-Asp) domain-containing protein